MSNLDPQKAVDLGDFAINVLVHHGRDNISDGDMLRVRALAQLGLRALAQRYKVLIDGERPNIDADEFDDTMRYMHGPF